MRLAGLTLHGDTAVGKQSLRLAGVTHYPFGAESGIRMLGKLAGQLADAVSNIGDGFAIRQRREQLGKGARGGGDVKTREQPGGPAGAQLALTGAHADAGAPAQVEQVFHRQIFDRVLNLAGGDRFALADQTAVLAAIAKPGGGTIAVAINGRPAQRCW